MRTHVLSLAFALSSVPAFAASDNGLRVALEQCFKSDRTGAGIAAAVIDNGTTASSYVCSDAQSVRLFDERTALKSALCPRR